jgi:hypothetical protein
MFTTKRSLSAALVGSIALFLILASLRASPPIGLWVQTWHYDAASQQVTVRLVNTSNKDITALSMSVTERYADGTSNSSEKMTDYLPLMASMEVSQKREHGNGTFAAGTSRDVPFPVAKEPKDVSIIVDMVAYADRTADVTNERAFNNLVDARKEVALATQQANQVMKDALAAPNPRDAAVKELARLADVAKGSGRGFAEITLRGHIQNARQATDLAALIKEGEARAAVYAPHAQLVKGGQQ